MVMTMNEAWQLIVRERSRLRSEIARSLYRRYRTEDAIDEAFGNTVAEFWKYASQGALTEGYERATLFRLARWQGIREGKRCWRCEAVNDLEPEPTDPDPGPEPWFAREEVLRWARAQLEGLPDPDRSIVERKLLDEESFANIAQSMGWELERVRARFYRALERVREAASGLLAA